MKVSEFIECLAVIEAEHGDIQVYLFVPRLNGGDTIPGATVRVQEESGHKIAVLT